MTQGFRDYLKAIQEMIANPELRAWFVSVLLRGALFGLLVIVFSAGLGGWWISTLGESAWFDFGAVVWIAGLIYFSGAVFGLVMSMGLPIFIREKKLVSAISGKPALQSSSLALSDHWREFGSSMVSIFVSLMAWPFLLIPVTLPFGVLMMAWAYSKEAHATSVRMSRQYGPALQLRAPRASTGYLIGVGLIPAMLSLVPFAAFFAWPTLLVSGVTRLKQNGKN